MSCSAIKFWGRSQPAKQRFGRLSGIKELDGVSLMQAAVVSTSVHPPPSISEEAASPAVGLTEQHEQEVDDSDNALLCHGVQWKVVDGVLEDWRCMARFGAHILWGNDVM